MQKIVPFIAFFAILSQTAVADNQRSGFYEAIKKNPYALLTDDYGILTGDDIAITACRFGPVQFNEDDYSGRFWKCYLTKDVKFECDEPFFVENEEELEVFYTFTASERDKSSTYYPRRHVPVSVCKDLKRRWNQLTKNQKHVCLLGVYDGKRIEDQNGSTTKELIWRWNSLRTKKGCEADFAEDCSLKKSIKSGCKL
jgi:hypothetical protein